jgi:hypothetical protein
VGKEGDDDSDDSDEAERSRKKVVQTWLIEIETLELCY